MKIKLAIIFILSMLLVASSALADDLQNTAKASSAVKGPAGKGEAAKASKGEPWKFSADRVVAEHDSEYVQAYGNVTFRSGKNYLKADFARFYQATKWVYLKGNVQAHWNGDFYQAEEAEFDLKNMVGWLKKGRVFVASPHVYFESEFIEKHNGATYTFKDAKVTACDGENPLWSFESGEGDITLNGWANLWHSTFKVKGVPVLYSPYINLPVKRKRQSGMLTPEVGSSDKLGAKASVPLYWAINDEMDATFYAEYYGKRGFRPGIEFRHTQDVNSKGEWHADWIYDDKSFDNESDGDNPFSSDGLIRSNHNRWWVRSKYNGYLGNPDWQTFLDIDVVSDQDYLREFRSGANGYEKTRDQFVSEFGRDIQAADAQNRTSTALVSRSWDKYALSARIEYTDSLVYRNGNNPSSKDPTLQHLPQIDAYAFKDYIPGTPLEWEGSIRGDYFWREYGMSGGRIDMNPSVSMPVKLGYVTIMPRAGVRATSYMIGSFQNASSEVSRDSMQGRLLGEAGISAFSEYYRVFNVSDAPAVSNSSIGESNWVSVKHSFIPRLEYNWVQDDPDQEKLPYFDARDRISSQNDITFSLTNVFDRKAATVVRGRNGLPVLSNSYLEFLRFRVEQGYDIDEARRTVELDEYESRPFSDTMGEVLVTPLNWVSLRSRTWFSPYLLDVTENENVLKVFDDNYGYLLFGYDYLRAIDEYKRQSDDSMQVVRYGAKARLPYGFVLGGEFRSDLNAGRDLEKTATLGWNHQCFSLEFVASKTTVDERYSVNFNLFPMDNYLD
ncbi:LPS-assembly protein LptD [Maridesulfovibrio bastinii]|uniref:LPS-assembly protein LptD n=1 Tax=Maridesulfovibrio bastinii TaxID=47157 RepID=UPI0004005D00|nr:LPS assembly protein LptD [Maridesulfovibrio bastinii]